MRAVNASAFCLRVGGGFLAAFLDGQLRGVKLLLDLQIAVHQPASRIRCGGAMAIGVCRENRRGQKSAGTDRQ